MGPMTTATHPRQRAAHDHLTRPDGGPVRALVVDDEPTIAELLSMALRYEGWEVQTALTGLAAVKAAKSCASPTSSCST